MSAVGSATNRVALRRGDESFAEWPGLGLAPPSAAEVEPEHSTFVVQGAGGSGSSGRWELAHHLWEVQPLWAR